MCRRSSQSPVFLVLLVLWAAHPARAVQDGTVSIGTLEGENWVARDIELRFRFDAEDNLTARGRVGRIEIPGILEEAGALSFSCADLTLYTDGLFDCPEGALRWMKGPFAVPLSVRVDHQRGGRLSFTFEGPEGGSQFKGHGDWSREGWRLSLETGNLDPSIIVEPTAASAAGHLALALEVIANAEGMTDIRVDARSDGLGFSDAAGANAAEDLVFHLTAAARRDSRDWRAEVSGGLEAGQVYVEPVFLDLTRQPASLTATAHWTGDSGALEARLDVRQQDVARVTADAKLVNGVIEALRLDLTDGFVPGLYTAWLQPFLIGTLADDLETSGGMHGRVERAGGEYKLELHLADVHLDDRRGRIGAYGLDGELLWDTGSPSVSRLRLEGAHLYHLNVGAVDVGLETREDGARLLEPVDIPLLDGALNIRELNVGKWGTPEGRLEIQADLSPISLEAFTHALGLPILGGRLAGHVPSIVFADGDLTLQGLLRLDVLDGHVTVADLVVEDLLGLVPRLSAEVTLDDLDLQLLTGAYSFGRVTGRLDGAISGLQMVAWEPVRFDAWFRTPADDDGPHRISQQAVDNLTALGGGISGTLSNTFLRFFEEFRYDRLGLSCRLEKGVCEMDGIAPAAEGYYIVRGSGLPRIDVIGFTRRVAWADLVRRLQRITRENALVVN